jgi:hypothetical protein
MNAMMGMLRRPAFWLAAAGILGTTGLALGNGWITGAMLLTVLIAAAPCLVMCALGLCMKGGEGGSCKKQGASDAPPVQVGRAADADPR